MIVYCSRNSSTLACSKIVLIISLKMKRTYRWLIESHQIKQADSNLFNRKLCATLCKLSSGYQLINRYSQTQILNLVSLAANIHE